METNDAGKIQRKNHNRKKFTLLEISGAFGDWGTLIPYIIGYVSIVGLNPAGIFFCLGITNIILGIRFNLPLPVQPQKTIGAVAIAQSWTPQMVISTGFGTGVIWTILGFSRRLNTWVKKVPKVVVRAIQMGLTLILGWMAVELLISDVLVSFIAGLIIVVCLFFPKAPSALILTLFGVILIFIQTELSIETFIPTVPEISIFVPSWEDLLNGFIYAGFAQLILTFTNVMVATVALANELFPDREHPLEARQLATNMGIINLTSPFVGGMPLCHGSGGLAAQYRFGARTGGSMIVEGLIEVIFGVFFADLLFFIFSNFPDAIFGVLLLFTAIMLAKVSVKKADRIDIPIIAISAIGSFIWNVSIGFLIAIILYAVFEGLKRIKNGSNN